MNNQLFFLGRSLSINYAVFLLIMSWSVTAISQEKLEIDGKVRITAMDVSDSDSIVVWGSDGILARRDASTLTQVQILSISNDTIYLSDGEFAKLPPDNNAGWTMDADTIFTSKKFVGIGTTTPNANLHISDITNDNSPATLKIKGNGEFDVDGASMIIIDGYRGSKGADAGSIKFDLHGNDGAKISSRVGMDNSVVKGANLVFSTSSDTLEGNTDRMTISNTGNVGIGMITPSQKLDVDGKARIRNIDNNNTLDRLLVTDNNGLIQYRNISSIPYGCGYAIGDSTEGGIIFYLDPSGCHGLVCAVADQSAGIVWDSINDGDSYSSDIFVNATSSGIGAGWENTVAITFNQTWIKIPRVSISAARLCHDLSLNGFDDWYLPSLHELILMYENIGQGNKLGLGNIGGFHNSDSYWSSTVGFTYPDIPDNAEFGAWAITFDGFFKGDRSNDPYDEENRVRAIRSF